MSKKIGFILVLFAFFMTGCTSSNYQTIDQNQALELINNNNMVIIDVREVDEYANGHIENAINIPLGSIETIDLDKDTYIMVYCASGVRSLSAVKKLEEMGYTHLYNLDGGLINWGFEGE